MPSAKGRRSVMVSEMALVMGASLDAARVCLVGAPAQGVGLKGRVWSLCDAECMLAGEIAERIGHAAAFWRLIPRPIPPSRSNTTGCCRRTTRRMLVG